MSEIPLGLYVHFPWCLRKCPYCDFNSHEAKGGLPQADYLAALMNDLDYERSRTSRDMETVFIGGGTPSLMSPTCVAELLDTVRKSQGTRPVEITIEANPGAADVAGFARFRDAGINRISIGVQSFDDASLRAIGRIHDATDARIACEATRDAGFTNVNIDLMYGLPGQDTEGALADLRAAIRLAPEHISWYELTIEKNTRFYSRPPPIPGEDILDDIYRRGLILLQEAGYRQYEVSAYARGGRECHHNLNYWRFGDYLGIGAGAHGKVTASRGLLRTRKTRAPADYLRQDAMDATRVDAVSQADIPREFLMNALRLNEGFTEALFEGRTGLPFSVLDLFLDEGERKGLLTRETSVCGGQEGRRVKTTGPGRRFLDTLLTLA